MHLYKQQKELQPSTYYVQSFTINSRFYLLDGPTDTHTYTHTPKKLRQRPLETSSNSEDRGAEAQSSILTSPPRVVLERSESQTPITQR